MNEGPAWGPREKSTTMKWFRVVLLSHRRMRCITLLCAICVLHVPLRGSDATFRVLVTSGAESELSKQQFTATVDGHPATVLDAVRADKEPLVFAILLDVSGSSRDTGAYAQQSVLDVFRRLSDGQSVGFYGEVNDEVYLPHKPATVESITQTFKEQGRFRGGTALYDALVKAATLVNKTAGDTKKRRAVIVLTDGDDSASTVSLSKALAEVQRQAVPVFCVGLLGKKSRKQDVAGLRTIGEATGGAAFLLSGPADVATPIMQMVRNQYWVSLARTAPADHKLHSLSVKGEDKQQVYAPTAVLSR